jgi:hypothetical protein
MIIVTLVIEQLLVNIWMCVHARVLLAASFMRARLRVTAHACVEPPYVLCRVQVLRKGC